MKWSIVIFHETIAYTKRRFLLSMDLIRSSVIPRRLSFPYADQCPLGGSPFWSRNCRIAAPSLRDKAAQTTAACRRSWLKSVRSRKALRRRVIKNCKVMVLASKVASSILMSWEHSAITFQAISDWSVNFALRNSINVTCGDWRTKVNSNKASWPRLDRTAPCPEHRKPIDARLRIF